MANSAVTLSSGVVSTVTVDGDHDEIEVIQLSGTPVAVYYTIGTDASTTPNPAAGTIGAGQGGVVRSCRGGRRVPQASPPGRGASHGGQVHCYRHPRRRRAAVGGEGGH